MVRAGNGVVGTEDELADLQRRFHLLEGDRKAFYEASQWTIKQNKETLELMKEENKHFREALALLQKDRGLVTNQGAGNTVERLTAEVNELKKKYNELKHISKVRQKDLTSRNDELRDLERDSGARTSSDNPLARQIRILENKLEKATMKCNEAAAFRKTYDHIIARLKDEKRHFDVQLAQAMETLRAKEADLAELIQMSNDAHRAKEAAKAELAKLELTIAEERKIRQKELAERRKLVQAKIEVNQRMEQRERKRRELQLEAAGELNLDGEQSLIKNYVAQGFYSASAEHELQMQKDKVSTYEDAFRRIKEATGIEDINEVIDKFLTQDETAANLTQLTKEAQSRIEALNDEKNIAKAKVEELRYAGPASFGSRRIVDEYDAKLAEANARCDKNRKRFDKMARLLVNTKAGIDHLADRLHIPTSQVGELTDDNVVQVLCMCESKLLQLVQVANESRDKGGHDDERGGSGHDPSGPGGAPLSHKMLGPGFSHSSAGGLGGGGGLYPPGGAGGSAGGHGAAAAAAAGGVNNVRVALSDGEDGISDDSDEEEGDEDDVPPVDRMLLKDTAAALVDKANRKGKARRVKPPPPRTGTGPGNEAGGEAAADGAKADPATRSIPRRR